MRKAVPALALAFLLAFHPGLASSQTPTCNFSLSTQMVVPNTNYWVGVERSVCQTGPGSYYHVERVLLTQGHPFQPGSVTILAFVYYSYRTTGADGSGTVQDVAAVQSESKNASVTYRSDRNTLGFTTCRVTAAYAEPPSATSATVPMNACAPHELTYV